MEHFESIQKLLCGLFGRPTRTFDCRLFDADGQGFIRGDTFRVISKMNIIPSFFPSSSQVMNIIINIIISFHHDHCCYINPEKNFPQGILLEIDEDFTDEELDGIMAEVDFSHFVHRNH